MSLKEREIFFQKKIESEPVRSLRKKLKKEHEMSLSVRSRYDFSTPLYFLILECFILFPDSFWVHWMIWCGRHGPLVCFVMFFFYVHALLGPHVPMSLFLFGKHLMY